MRLFSTLLFILLLVPAATAQHALGVDTTNFERSTRPQDDFFQFVNGSWLERVAIPSDRPSYGAFDQLREAADVDVRALIEDAAAGRVVDPDARKIGDLYASYFDSTRAASLGLAPVQSDLDRIEAVTSYEDLARYFGENGWEFGPRPFAWNVGVDDRNSDRYITTLSQSGLGLPDKSYYEEDQFADARAA